MATIHTGEWLRLALKEKGWTQKNLSDKTGISVNAISKIIRGERFGSVESWDKIKKALQLKEPKISFSCEDVIEELKDVIEDYEEIGVGPESWELHVYYEVFHGTIQFYDFLTEVEIEENGVDADLKGKSYIKISAKEALELFEAQNKIF